MIRNWCSCSGEWGEKCGLAGVWNRVGEVKARDLPRWILLEYNLLLTFASETTGLKNSVHEANRFSYLKSHSTCMTAYKEEHPDLTTNSTINRPVRSLRMPNDPSSSFTRLDVARSRSSLKTKSPRNEFASLFTQSVPR